MDSIHAGGSYAFQKLRALGCSENVARTYATKTTIRSFSAGDFIWQKGARITHWSSIINGMVSASLESPGKDDAHISLYGENSWFGEHCILANKPCFANYRSLVSVDVLQISAECVLELLDSEVAFASRIAKITSWRMQRTSEMLMIMRMGSPILRTVFGISQFAETLAYNADRPPTSGFGSEITLPVNQTVLASLCGVSRSKLSTVIQALSAAGWLRLEYGRIEVLNLPAWHSFAASFRDAQPLNLDPSIEDLITALDSCAILG